MRGVCEPLAIRICTAPCTNVSSYVAHRRIDVATVGLIATMAEAIPANWRFHAALRVAAAVGCNTLIGAAGLTHITTSQLVGQPESGAVVTAARTASLTSAGVCG